MTAYAEAMNGLLAGEGLGRVLAQRTMGEVLEGSCDAAQVGALLGVLATRSPSADELAGFATAMRARATPLPCDGPLVDTCGTGGSGLDTINTSTVVALVLSAGGLTVAKHGNRASSGKCGSADVLEEVGVPLDLTPVALGRLLETHRFAFLFAPRFHPALGPIGPIRRALGFRTVFNLLGPLCNPAGAQAQVLGVSDAHVAPLMAQALHELGCSHALVVHGEDGLDELTTCAATRTWELREGKVQEGRITPEELGLHRARPQDIRGGDRKRNTQVFLDLLSGRGEAAHEDLVVLNAGAGLYVAGKAQTLAEGVAQARAILRGGEAARVLEAYRQASRVEAV